MSYLGKSLAAARATIGSHYGLEYPGQLPVHLFGIDSHDHWSGVTWCNEDLPFQLDYPLSDCIQSVRGDAISGRKGGTTKYKLGVSRIEDGPASHVWGFGTVSGISLESADVVVARLGFRGRTRLLG